MPKTMAISSPTLFLFFTSLLLFGFINQSSSSPLLPQLNRPSHLINSLHSLDYTPLSQSSLANTVRDTQPDDDDDDDDDDENENESDDTNSHTQDKTTDSTQPDHQTSTTDNTSDSTTTSATEHSDPEKKDDATQPAQDDGDEPDDANDSDSPPSTTTTSTTTNTTNLTSSDTNATVSATSSTNEAFVQFEIFKMEELRDTNNDPFKLVSIFKNTSFVGPFAGSPTTSDITVLEKADNTSWYEENVVQDRISFQFRYDPELETSYAISEPTIAVPPLAGIEPKVDYKIYPDSGMGTFTVFYHCVMGKPGAFPISLTLTVTKDHKIETGWIKSCGKGRFDLIQFGFVDHESNWVSFNADGTYGIDEHKKLEVGPMDPSTDLKVQLLTPATNLNFLTPYVMSNTPDVTLKLRSTVAAGTFAEDVETKFTILYDCVARATADIKFTVSVPPWDNVTATWRKDCGGSMSQALLIGTGGPQSFDVMQEGDLKPEFKVTEVDSVQTADPRVKVVGADIHSQRFYLTNSDDTSEIHFQKVSITLSNPSIMRVVVGSGSSRSSVSSVGGVLQRGESKALDLFFMCRGVGKTVVLVTLPTVRYQNVEFGFVKECDGAPKVYRHMGFLQTAGSLLDVILVLGVGGAIGLCVYSIRKRAVGAKYAAVSVTET